jgi:hypothetical protein
MNRNDIDSVGSSAPGSSEPDFRTLLLDAYPNGKEQKRELVPQLAVDAIKIRYAAELYFNKANIAYRLAQDRVPGVGPDQQDYDRWNAMSAEELLEEVKVHPEKFNRTVLTNCAVHRLIRSLKFDIDAYDEGIRSAGCLEGVHSVLGRIVTLAFASATFGVTEAVDLAAQAENAAKTFGHVLPTAIINPQITGRFRIVTDIWERTKRKGGSSVLAPNIQKARWMSINYGELKKLKEQLDPLLSDIKTHVDAGNPVPEDSFKRLQDLIKAGNEEAKRYKETANWNKTNTWSKGYGGVVNFMGATGVVTSIGMPAVGLPILAASIPAQWFAGMADEKNKHEYNFRSNLESGDILTDEGKSVPVMDLTVDHINQDALRALQKPFAVDMVDLVREIYQNELGELKRKISKRAEKVNTLKKTSTLHESGRAPSEANVQKISSLENEIAQLKKRFDEILTEAAKFESFDREQWRQLDGEKLIGKCLDNTKYLRKEGVKAANNRPGEKEAQILQRYFHAFAGFASLGLTTPVSDLIAFIDAIPKTDATNAAIGMQTVGGAVFTANTGEVRTQKAYNKGELAKAMEHVAEVKAKLDAEKDDWTVNIDIDVPGQESKQYKIDLRKTGGFNKYFHTQRQRLRRAAGIILPNLLSPPKGVWNALKARSMLKALKASMVETRNTLAKAPNLIARKHEDGRVQRKKSFAALTEEILSYQQRRTLEEPSYSTAFKNNVPDENRKAKQVHQLRSSEQQVRKEAEKGIPIVEKGKKMASDKKSGIRKTIKGLFSKRSENLNDSEGSHSKSDLGPDARRAESAGEGSPPDGTELPFVGYVAYPFAGEAPDFDPNATKGASRKKAKNLAPDLQWNERSTHLKAVMQPMIGEFEDRLQRLGTPGRIGLKPLNYLDVYREGAKALENQLLQSGIKIPPQVNKNTFSDHEHIKNKAGSNTYYKSIRNDDPALKSLPPTHLSQKMKEEAELVRYKRLRHFALYRMSAGVESLRELYEIDPSKREPVLKSRFASIDQVNEFFKGKFDGFQIPDIAITKQVKVIFSGAKTAAEKNGLLENYLHYLLDHHIPYGSRLNALARNSIQGEFDQARYAATALQQFKLSDGAECIKGKDGAFVLRQPYGNKCELRIDKGLVTFTLEGHTPEVLKDYVAFSKVDRYFQRDILASLFGDEKTRKFDDIRNMTFESLYGRLTAPNMRQTKIEALVNEPFKQAVDKALEGVINFHGTDISYNLAHSGKQFGVEHRDLVMGLVIDKARRGELFISGSGGFQQELVWHSGGHIIALQDISGKTFLANSHAGGKNTYTSIEAHTDTAGVTEKPMGQFEDGRKAWAPRDVKPLVIELGGGRKAADDKVEKDKEGNIVEFEPIKASPVRFQGQPVLVSEDLQQEDDRGNGEYVFTRRLREPLGDDEGNVIVDENGKEILEQEKIIVKMAPQTRTIVRPGAPIFDKETGEQVGEAPAEIIEVRVETPQITGIERWVRVPMQDDKGDFKTEKPGKRMLCTYQKVIQDGSETNPINPEILLDRVYIPIDCAHTQSGFNVDYAPLTPGVKVVGHSIKPNDIIRGGAIPAATKSNPKSHPVHFPPNTLGEVAIAENMELTLGQRVTGRTNQYLTDGIMHGGGKQWPEKATSKWRSLKKLFGLNESEAEESQVRGMNSHYSVHYTEPVEKQYWGNREGVVDAMQSGLYIKQTRDMFNEFNELNERVASRDQKLYAALVRYKGERSAEACGELIAELKRLEMFDDLAVIEHGDECLSAERVDDRFRVLIDNLSEFRGQFAETSDEYKQVDDTIKEAAHIGETLGGIIGAKEAGQIGHDIQGDVRDIAHRFNLLKDVLDERQTALKKPSLDAIAGLVGDLEQWLNAPSELISKFDVTRGPDGAIHAARPNVISQAAINPDPEEQKKIKERIERARNKYRPPEGEQELDARAKAAMRKIENKPEPRPFPEIREPDVAEEISQVSDEVSEQVEVREKDPMRCWQILIDARIDAKNDDDPAVQRNALAVQRKAAEDLMHSEVFSSLSDDEKANHAQAWVDLVNSQDFVELNRTAADIAQHEVDIRKSALDLEESKKRLVKLSVPASKPRLRFRYAGINGIKPIALGLKASAANFLLFTTTVGQTAGEGATTAAYGAASAAFGYALPFTALLVAMGVEQVRGGVYGKQRVNALLKVMREYERGLRKEKSKLETVRNNIAETVRKNITTIKVEHSETEGGNQDTVTVGDPKQVIASDIAGAALGEIERRLRHTKARLEVVRNNKHTQMLHIAGGLTLTGIGVSASIASALNFGASIAMAKAAGGAKVTVAAKVAGAVNVATGFVAAAGVLIAGQGAIMSFIAARRIYNRRKLQKSVAKLKLGQDSRLMLKFNEIEQARRKAYTFDLANGLVRTSSGIMMAVGATTKMVPLLIAGGIGTMLTTGAAFILPKREWRGRNIRAGGNTTHVNLDFLASNARKSRLMSTLEAQLGATQKALLEISQTIDGSNQFSEKIGNQFRYTMESERWKRWLIMDADKLKLSKTIAGNFEKTKDHQLDLMKATTKQEHEWLAFEVSEKDNELKEIKHRIELIQKVYPKKDYSESSEHEEDNAIYVTWMSLQAQYAKAEQDLNDAKERKGAIKDLHDRLIDFYNEHQNRKLEKVDREVFDDLRRRYLVAHDLLPDVMSRHETRELARLQKNKGENHFIANIAGEMYPGSEKPVKKGGRVRVVKFKYTDQCMEFLRDNLDRQDNVTNDEAQSEITHKCLNDRFAHMMCMSSMEKMSYEVNTIVDILEVELKHEIEEEKEKRDRLKKGEPIERPTSIQYGAVESSSNAPSTSARSRDPEQAPPLIVHGQTEAWCGQVALQNLEREEKGLFTSAETKRTLLELYVQGREQGDLLSNEKTGLTKTDGLTLDAVRAMSEKQLNEHVPTGAKVNFSVAAKELAFDPHGDLSRDLVHELMKRFMPSTQAINRTDAGAPLTLEKLKETWTAHLNPERNNVESAVIHIIKPSLTSPSVRQGHYVGLTQHHGQWCLVDSLDRTKPLLVKGWTPGYTPPATEGGSYFPLPGKTAAEQLVNLPAALKNAFQGITDFAAGATVEILASPDKPRARIKEHEQQAESLNLEDESVYELTHENYEDTLKKRLDLEEREPTEPSSVFDDLNKTWRQQLKSRMEFFEFQKTLSTGNIRDQAFSHPGPDGASSSTDQGNPTISALRNIIKGFQNLPLPDEASGEKRLAADAVVQAATRLIVLYERKYNEALAAENAKRVVDHHQTGSSTIAAVASAAHEGEGGLGLAISELDEAASGLYTAIGYAWSANKDGVKKIEDTLSKKADLLEKNVREWVADSGTSSGLFDILVHTILPPAIIVLAVKAIAAGYKEWEHSKHTIEHLEEEMPQLEKCIRAIKDLTSGKAGLSPEEAASALPEDVKDLLKAEKISKETILEHLEFARKRAEENKVVGLGTLVAGATVLGKTAFIASSKIATFAAGKAGVASAIAGATTFATVAGATNMALGPIAGAAAVVTGVKLHQSTAKRREHLEDVMPKTRSFLAGSRQAEDAQASLKSYADFIETKLSQRLTFYKSSNRWNANIVCGGALYGLSATAQGAITIIALAGAGAALSNPVTAGVLIGGLAAGALWMGVSASHLTTAGPKYERYGKSFWGDNPEVERNFLASLDVQSQLSSNIDPLIGVKTRAALFESLTDSERLRQNILHNNGTGKQYRDLYIYSTDANEVREEREKQNASTGKNVWWREKKANWSGPSVLARLKKPAVFLANLPQGRKEATKKAKKAYGETASYLTKTHFAEHLKSTETDHTGPGGLFDNLAKMIEENAKYYRQKIEVKQKVYSEISLSKTFENAQANTAEIGSDQSTEGREALRLAKIAGATVFKETLQELDKQLERDMMMYSQTMRVATSLHAYSNKAITPETPELSDVLQQFMSLRRGNPYIESRKTPHLAESWERLAEFLLVDERRLFRERKTLLVDVENDAALRREAMDRMLNAGAETVLDISAEAHSNDVASSLKTVSPSNFLEVKSAQEIDNLRTKDLPPDKLFDELSNKSDEEINAHSPIDPRWLELNDATLKAIQDGVDAALGEKDLEQAFVLVRIGYPLDRAEDTEQVIPKIAAGLSELESWRVHMKATYREAFERSRKQLVKPKQQEPAELEKLEKEVIKGLTQQLLNTDFVLQKVKQEPQFNKVDIEILLDKFDRRLVNNKGFSLKVLQKNPITGMHCLEVELSEKQIPLGKKLLGSTGKQSAVNAKKMVIGLNAGELQELLEKMGKESLSPGDKIDVRISSKGKWFGGGEKYEWEPKTPVSRSEKKPRSR